jgi:hypothetical protein
MISLYGTSLIGTYEPTTTMTHTTLKLLMRVVEGFPEHLLYPITVDVLSWITQSQPSHRDEVKATEEDYTNMRGWMVRYIHCEWR